MKSSHAEIAANLVRTLLEAVPDCRAIYRFGTWGSDAERPDSDIDLALLPLQPLEPLRRWELAQSLASLAGRDVDLIDLSTAPAVLKMQVVAHGERLFTPDVPEVEQFEDAVFSGYARLNEERSGILADVYERESVFG